MEQITLDLIPSGMLPVIHASQYDDGRVFKVNLTENGNPYTLSTEEITLKVRKGDGCAVTTAVTVVSGNTYVNIATTEQMTAVAFENLAELHIEKDGASIGTLNFLIRVEPDNLYGDRESGTEIHDLAHQVESEVDEVMSTKGAGDLAFDNTGTDLESTNTEDAIKEVDAKVNTKANASDVYDKTYMDGIFDQIDNAFTGVNTELGKKADKATTYTKNEVDTALSAKANTSDVDTALATKADKSDTYTKQSVDDKLAEKADTSSLATVATSGNYNDLSNKPTIPAAQVNSDWNANSGVAQILNKPTIPTKTSDLQNDSGFTTIDDSTTADDKTWSSEKTYNEIIDILPTGTASGSIANFETDLEVPLVTGKFGIVAQQESGTPTPSSPKAISGYTGMDITRCNNNIWGSGVGGPDTTGTYWGWHIQFNTNARVVLFDKDTTQDISGIYFGFTDTGKDASGLGAKWVINNGTVNLSQSLTTDRHYISIYPANATVLERLFNRFYVMVVVDDIVSPNETLPL